MRLLTLICSLKKLKGIQAFESLGDFKYWSLERISSTTTQWEAEFDFEGSSRLGAEGISAWTSLCGRQSACSSWLSDWSSSMINGYYLEGSSSIN